MPKITQEEWDQWLAQHCMIPPDMDKLADSVRETFLRFKRDIYPHSGINHKRYTQTYWWNITKKIMDEGMDQAEWISICFERHGGLCRPEHLLDHTSRQIYRERITKLRANTRQMLKLHIEKLRALMSSKYADLRTTLIDERSMFSALFVYCIARREGLDDLAVQYWPYAERRLRIPAEREIYGEFFPEVIRNAGK